MKSKVKAANINNYSILGTYEGECADATITNKNGLDITRPVWEGVFASEDYKQAIELGWYIGFLGHPEDPGCQDFEHACIVMTEGHIDNDGKVYGTFNLIDTPVGKIVKAFQDAGVTFGISVRGAGDIIDSSVDPDTFTFRGFDLVTFPAFPDAIPTFTEIAASTDVNKRKQYKIVCSAVNSNLEQINSMSTLNTIQSQFAKQSDEYKKIEARKTELDTDTEDITPDKVEALTNLYSSEVAANKRLQSENRVLRNRLNSAKRDYSARIASTMRIAQSQLDASNEDNNRLRKKIRILSSTLSDVKESNLKYIKRVNSSKSDLSRKDSVISNLREQLNETVDEGYEAKERASDLGVENVELQRQVEATEKEIKSVKNEIKSTKKLLSDYQQAFAELYASVVGGKSTDVITSSTISVSKLKSNIDATVDMNTESYEDVFATTNISDISIVGDGDDNNLITV